MKLKNIVSSLAFIFAGSFVNAATILDDFESNSFSGGTGWSNSWTGAQNFVSGVTRIDGNHSGGLFGTSSISRNFSAITTGTVTVNWSIRGLGGIGNFNEIGLNILGLKSNSQTVVATLKFDDDFLSTLRLNDGGSDFSFGTVGYSDSAIYDFSFSSTVGTSNYSWSVTERGGSTASGIDFTYSGSGTTLTNINGLGFFWSGEAGSGNDGFIDSISVVPEPSAALLGGLGALMLLRRRRL